MKYFLIGFLGTLLVGVAFSVGEIKDELKEIHYLVNEVVCEALEREKTYEE